MAYGTMSAEQERIVSDARIEKTSRINPAAHTVRAVR